jgi:hypothetical protein
VMNFALLINYHSSYLESMSALRCGINGLSSGRLFMRMFSSFLCLDTF